MGRSVISSSGLRRCHPAAMARAASPAVRVPANLSGAIRMRMRCLNSRERLLSRREQHARRDPVDREGDIPWRREGRCDTDVAIRRILPVWVGRARRCQRNPCGLGELHHTRRGAVYDLEADEITALRLVPPRDTAAAEPFAPVSYTHLRAHETVLDL